MDQSQCPCPSSAAVQTLRRQIARIETLRRRPDEPPVSSGCPPLDGILPEGGFHRGTLTEWLADGDGAGATTLAVLAAREACRQGGTLVVVDADGGFYPPAAVRLGIAPGQLLVVRAEQRADHDWALDQALRCPAVAAVLAWPESPAGRLDDRTFRRLQLAAEAGGSLGLLVRPAESRHVALLGRRAAAGPAAAGRIASPPPADRALAVSRQPRRPRYPSGTGR